MPATLDPVRAHSFATEMYTSAPVGIQFVDAAGKILDVNSTQLELLTLAPDEYLNHNFAEFFADLDIAAVFLTRIFKGEWVHELTADLVARDGSLRNVSLYSKPLDPGGLVWIIQRGEESR